MGRLLQLFPGTWYAGLQRPMFVSRSMVETLLRDALPPPAAAHVQAFHWHERKAEFPPMDPHNDPAYRDEWDEWFDVEFSGELVSVLVPDQLAWVLGRAAGQPQLQPAPPPPAPTPTPAPSSAPIIITREPPIGGVLLVLLVLWSLSRR